MVGPGEYVADVTEGVGQAKDLPKARVLWRSRNYPHLRCPLCSRSAYRVRAVHRVLHELSDLISGRPLDIHLTYSQHHCVSCGLYFQTDLSDWALPKSHYTLRVTALAVRLVVEDSLPYRAASWHLWRDHRVFVPFATIQNWVEAGGKKSDRAGPEPVCGGGPGGLLRLRGRR